MCMIMDGINQFISRGGVIGKKGTGPEWPTEAAFLYKYRLVEDILG